MKPTVGRIVHYVVSKLDADQMATRRTTSYSIAERMKAAVWPFGAQAHIGNTVVEGNIFPLIITKVWNPELVNGQVLLDGNDVLWVSSAHHGAEAGTWHWPAREE